MAKKGKNIKKVYESFDSKALYSLKEAIELVKKLNPRTGEVLEENPKFLKTGDAAIVKVKPLKPLPAEVFKDFPALGRFAIRDMGKTVAAGIIIDAVKRQ